MNILYLDLDALRPDHLGCYGYHRATSPNLDALAADGVRFDKAYCSDAPCCPSRTALMSGQFGINNGVVCHHGSAGDLRTDGPGRGFQDRIGRESLPAVLREAGYHTASISPFYERHSAWWFNAGFAEIHNTGKCGMESAEEVTPSVIEWLQGHSESDRPWFLHVNYWDVHMPARVPEDYGQPFADEPLSSYYNEANMKGWREAEGLQAPVEKQKSFAGYRNGTMRPRWPGAKGTTVRYPRCPETIQTLEDVRAIVDEYDTSIRYLDEHVGQVIGELKSLGLWDDTMIVVSADHGENFGELGIFGDHKTADEVTCHVPLIVRMPGTSGGSVDTGLRYHLDLAPTLADLVGADAPAAWDGRSYATALHGNDGKGWDELVLSVGWGTQQRSLRFENWLYIRTDHCGYNFYPRDMLFDVETDPHQEHNLADDYPDLCRQASDRIEAWRSRNLEKQPDAGRGDPFDTVREEGGPMRGQLPGYLERLEARGRAAEADHLRQRYPDEANAGRR